MSKLIRDVSMDIKCKIKNADRDIRKAIERKNDYLDLANLYYNFSIDNLEEALDLHKQVVRFIEDYKKQNNDVPSIMLSMWEFEHRDIMEDVTEIKTLQEFYKEL